MPKIRVHQLAKELNISNEKVIEYLTKKKVKVKNHFSALDEDTVTMVKRMIEKESERTKARAIKPVKESERAGKKPEKIVAVVKEEGVGEDIDSKPEEVEVPKEKIEIHEGASVKDFAEAIGKPPNDLIKMMIALGEMVTINQQISHEAIDVLAEELHLEVEILTVEDEEEEIIDDEASLKPRPPIVTVMGHVDHGKTLLLDAIRETDVVSGEAGGITQHIGAYQVEHGGKPVTFIDTPGHEAFTAMRARGASITDIAVLVVAADDAVMPQTVEAIDHAKAAGVPIVVAINKMDKPEANPDKVRKELSEHQLIAEDWGGDTVFVEVSAKQRTNINDLVDMVILVADIGDLKANPDALASGVVVEARLDKGRGPVASVLIQRGTLKVGDPLVIGKVFGKVRAMLDDKGKHLKEAKPAQPVEILGLSSVPSPGDKLRVYEEEKMARQVAEEREIKAPYAKVEKERAERARIERLKEVELTELREEKARQERSAVRFEAKAVYFDFDKSFIRPEYRPTLKSKAEFLKDNPNIHVRIEGNCDERGTSEYNLALGERRCNSAEKFLVSLGISPDRIESISYGEEKPLALGHNEDSWTQNRRDDFVIIKK